MSDAFLDDVRAELMLRQLWDVGLEAVAHWVGEYNIIEIHNVLKDIVSEGILNERERILRDLSDQIGFLLSRSMVDAALENTTSVAMCSNNYAVLPDSIEDELSILWR